MQAVIIIMTKYGATADITAQELCVWRNLDREPGGRVLPNRVPRDAGWARSAWQSLSGRALGGEGDELIRSDHPSWILRNEAECVHR